MFSVFSCFQLETVPEIGLLGEEGNRTRKQRMRNKRPWPSHVFTSFARSSINTLVSQALDLQKKKSKQKTLTGEKKFPLLHADKKTLQHAWKSSSHRGDFFPPLELFHTLPLSPGTAEPYNYAPAVPQHPPTMALPTAVTMRAGTMPSAGLRRRRWPRRLHPPLRTKTP